MRRVVMAIALAVYLLAIWRLTVDENGGVPHAELELRGAVPATLFLPGPGNPFFQTSPPPPDKRPPAVILVHGFGGDRALMSTLARWMATNGYGVISIDLRGHGANRNPFVNDFVRNNALYRDLEAAAEYARNSPYLDGSRIIVAGHSMGAIAALATASRDPNLLGAIMISGGFRLDGPNRPPNALFIFAQRDPESIRQTSMAIAAQLAGRDQVELGKTAGEFANRSAVRAIEIPGENHLSIVTSKAAGAHIIEWLDASTGFARPGPIVLQDPRRLAAAFAFAAFLVLVSGVGTMVGRLAPAAETLEIGTGWPGLLWIAAALLAGMFAVATSQPAYFVSLEVADVQVGWLGAAGVLLVLAYALRRKVSIRSIFADLKESILPAAFGFAIIYALMVPISVVFHRLAPTPERLGMATLAAFLILPFFAMFELILRGGALIESTLQASAGRGLIIVFSLLGALLGVMPFVLILILPSIAIMFIMFEIFATSVYSERGGSLLAIALVESAWLAWILAATMPIRI